MPQTKAVHKTDKNAGSGNSEQMCQGGRGRRGSQGLSQRTMKIALLCTALLKGLCTALLCFALLYFAFDCIALLFFALLCIALLSIALHCFALLCIAVH